MDRLLTSFMTSGKKVFVTGAAARAGDASGWTGLSERLEFISLCTRAETARILGIEDRRPHARGPLRVEVHVGDSPQKVYVFCVDHEVAGSDDEKLTEMLRRRALSADAMAVDPAGRLFDPFGGQEDIADGRINTTYDAEKAMRDDPLRALSLGRLVAETGLRPVASAIRGAEEASPYLLYLPREAWLREMTRLLCADHPGLGLQCLLETRALNMVLPEAVCMVDFSESSRYHHKDLWDHTLRVVEQSKREPSIRWAALLHDLGKVWTRTYGRKGTVHFYHHEELGAVISQWITHRFHMNAEMCSTIEFLVRHHLRPNAYEPEWTDSAVRRLITESGDYLEQLLDLSRADLTSGQERRRREAARLARELRERIARVKEMDARVPPLPKGLGAVLMREFDLKEGPRVGEMKRILEQAVEREEIDAGLDAERYVAFLKERGLPD